ncbi:MAG: MGMT family protein [Candidatus Sumerlaeia bacterium]
MVATELEIIWRTPIGPLTGRITTKGIRLLEFGQPAAFPAGPAEVRMLERRGGGAAATQSHAEAAEKFLVNYFRGEPAAEPPALDWTGASDFDRKVWRACSRIGFGRTLTYGELAGAIGKPDAARAVGGAMGRNPLPILVPCHRVLARGRNRLGGFSGGLALKRWLLAHEGIDLK